MKTVYNVVFAALILTLLSPALALSQASDWTKDDRNNIFNDCMGQLGKYPNLTNEQKESMSLCYLDELTKKYGKREYQNKIDIEIRKIRETTLTLCSKNLGMDLSEVQKVAEAAQEEPKKKEVSGNPTKDDLTGHWKDDNSEFWLFESGDYKIQYNDGKTSKGSWVIEKDQLTLFQDKFLRSSEKLFKILVFTSEKFVYQSIKNKKDTFTATRLK